MGNELVSIITPLYNNSRYVSLTIESVLSQTYGNWEMIIVDDCSTDNHAGSNVVSSYVKMDSRIKLYVLDKNRGSSGARNYGLSKAAGRYIALLDSDDLWDPDFLTKQLDFMKQNRDAALVYASYRMIDEKNNEILRPHRVRKKVGYRDLLIQNDIGCLTAVYDSHKTGKVYLDESMGSIRDDFELWLRIVKKHGPAYGNSAVLASYRVMAGSATSQKVKMIYPQWCVYRKIEKISFIPSLFYLVCWGIRGILKYRATSVKK